MLMAERVSGLDTPTAVESVSGVAVQFVCANAAHRSTRGRGSLVWHHGTCGYCPGDASVFALAAQADAIGPPWGPETPNFNLEVILRPAAGGPDNPFGLVKFRQPTDAQKIVYLDTWVRDLAPNTSYQLQRAVDTNVNDDFTGTTWLTLGKGRVAQTITTDDRGTGREQLWRELAVLGTQFDIHFRVIDAVSKAVVLESGCYQFTVSQ